jgi:hypothetical protein
VTVHEVWEKDLGAKNVFEGEKARMVERVVD